MDEFLIQIFLSIIFLFSCTIFIFNGAICSKGEAVKVNENVIKPQPPAPKPQIVRAKTPVPQTQPQPRAMTPIEAPPIEAPPIEAPPIEDSDESTLETSSSVSDYVEPEKVELKEEPESTPVPVPVPTPLKKPIVKMNFAYWDLSLSIAEEEKDNKKKVLTNTKTKPPILVQTTAETQINRKQSEISVKSEFFRKPMAQSSRKPSEVSIQSEIRERSKTPENILRRSSSIHKIGQPIVNMDFEKWDDNISIKDSEGRRSPLEKSISTPVSRKSSSRKSVQSKDLNKTPVNEEIPVYEEDNEEDPENFETIGNTTERKRQIKMGFDAWDCDISIEESVKLQNNETRQISSVASKKKVLISRNNSVVNNEDRKISSRNVLNRSQRNTKSRQSFNEDEKQNGEIEEPTIVSRKSSSNQILQEKSASRLPSIQNSRKSSTNSSVNTVENKVKSRQSVYDGEKQTGENEEENISQKSSSNQIIQKKSPSRVQSEISSRKSSTNKMYSNEVESNRVVSRQVSQTNDEVNQAKNDPSNISIPVSRKASSILSAKLNDSNFSNGDKEGYSSLNQTRNTQIKFEFNKWDHDIRIKEKIDTPSVSLHTPIDSDHLKESLNDIDDNDLSIHSNENMINHEDNHIRLSFKEWDKPLVITSP